MAFQSVPDTVEVFVRFVMQTIDVGFTLYYLRPGGYNTTLLEDLVDGLNPLADNIVTVMHTGCAYVGLHARGLEFVIDNQAELTVTPVAGTAADTPLPNSVALAIKRVSGNSGRGARGRIFAFGFTSGQLQTNENFLLQTVATSWLTYLEALDAQAVLDGWTPVIVSRYLNNVKRATGVTLTLQDWVIDDLRLDSRRDRMPD